MRPGNISLCTPVRSTPQGILNLIHEINSLAVGNQRATGFPMPVSLRTIVLGAILLTTGLPGTVSSLAAGQAFVRDVAAANVNQRYSIESISLGGVELDRMEPAKLPPSLRSRLTALIGQKCDMAALSDLAAEIRRELHFRSVTERLVKGTEPDMVKVDFDVAGGGVAFEVTVPKLLFTSQERATGELDGTMTFRGNRVTVGAVSNGDDLIERFSGLTARFDSAALGTDRVHASVAVEDYRERWDTATRDAVASQDDLYRSRWNVAPQLTFALARPVTVSVGASFEGMESESPGASNRTAKASTLEVRYGHKIEGGPVQQRVEAKYSLRVATRALGSTYAYARHIISFKYEARSGRHVASDAFTAGAISGDAPLFDRFVLGTSTALPGWDRFQIDPLGASRIVHNEMSYGYRVGEGTVEAFYDAGSVWQAGRQPIQQPAVLRHSVGFGYKQGIFILTTAFPIRNGRVEPVFMAGMNY
jgi:hypothetical protein